jgi:hypothetical protein
MAFSPQTFSVGQVLTAAQMNQTDTNIDEVRAHHKGSSLPASPVAGLFWLDDTLGAAENIMKEYDGADSIPWAVFDHTANEVGFLGTQPSSFAGANFADDVTLGAITGISNYTSNPSIASGQFSIMVPNTDIVSGSDASGGKLHSIMFGGTGADGRMGLAMGWFRGTGGTPAITTISSDTTINIGYTALSGYWIRNLTATQNCHYSVLRRR